MESKKPWFSRTILVNAVMGIVASVALFVPGASVVSTFITEHAAEIAIGWSVLNMILRAVTKDKIALTD